MRCPAPALKVPQVRQSEKHCVSQNPSLGPSLRSHLPRAVPALFAGSFPPPARPLDYKLLEAKDSVLCSV